MTIPRALAFTSLVSAAGWFALDLLMGRDARRHAAEFGG